MTHNPDFPISNVNQHRPRASTGLNNAGNPNAGKPGYTLEGIKLSGRGGQGGGPGGSTISFGGRPPSQLTDDFYNQFGTFQGLQDLVNQARRGGGGGGGGGGTRKQKIIDLDPFKNKELAAMRELLKQQTAGTRTELTGDRARIGNAFKRFEALRIKARDDSLQTNRGAASRRGFLDSGIFLKDKAEIGNISDTDISAEDTKSTALVDALSRQIGGKFDYLGRRAEDGEEIEDYGVGTLEALRSAQEASSTADIERSYLNARISQGGQG